MLKSIEAILLRIHSMGFGVMAEGDRAINGTLAFVASDARTGRFSECRSSAVINATLPMSWLNSLESILMATESRSSAWVSQMGNSNTK